MFCSEFLATTQCEDGKRVVTEEIQPMDAKIHYNDALDQLMNHYCRIF
jgi:hypothetical protein